MATDRKRDSKVIEESCTPRVYIDFAWADDSGPQRTLTFGPYLYLAYEGEKIIAHPYEKDEEQNHQFVLAIRTGDLWTICDGSNEGRTYELVAVHSVPPAAQTTK